MKAPVQSRMTTPDEAPTSEGTDHFGPNSTLGQISKFMEPNAFGILMDLILWARLWDGSYTAATEKTITLDWDDGLVRALLTPFKGFGNNARLYAIVEQKVVALIGREVPLWLGDPVYRRANSMVWCVLQSVAPSLAAESHGFEGQQAVVKILAKGFKDG